MSRIAPPVESRISDWYSGASLADSFAITLPPTAPRDIDTLATLLFTDPPLWFTILLAIRDRAVPLFDVKASHALVAADLAFFFPVLSRSPDETPSASTTAISTFEARCCYVARTASRPHDGRAATTCWAASIWR